MFINTYFCWKHSLLNYDGAIRKRIKKEEIPQHLDWVIVHPTPVIGMPVEEWPDNLEIAKKKKIGRIKLFLLWIGGYRILSEKFFPRDIEVKDFLSFKKMV